jgi:hypothetical protein
VGAPWVDFQPICLERKVEHVDLYDKFIQNTCYSSFSTYISFIIYVDAIYILVHNKGIVPRKVRMTSILKRRGYVRRLNKTSQTNPGSSSMSTNYKTYGTCVHRRNFNSQQISRFHIRMKPCNSCLRSKTGFTVVHEKIADILNRNGRLSVQPE